MGERILYQFHCSGASEKGPFKAHNEDAFCIRRAQTSYGDMALLVVSDGVGGLNYGELASAAIVKAFARWFEQNAPAVVETLGARTDALFSAVQGQWGGLLQMINLRIMQHALHEDCSMGATVTALLAFDGLGLVAHVGDTRLYKVGNQSAAALTHDQTWASAAAQGETPAQRGVPGNALTQCVGATQVLAPEFNTFPLDDSATYVLCSDGFYASLTESELCNFLAPERYDSPERLLNADKTSALWLRETGAISPENQPGVGESLSLKQNQHLQALTQVVLARGARDNITILALRPLRVSALSYGGSI